MNKRHLLISGPHHIGKTTALLRIRDGLTVPSRGFHTRSLYDGHRKTGLQLVTSRDEVFTIADTMAGTGANKYKVRPTSLDDAIQSAFSDLAEGMMVYVDEIGTVLCQSPLFIHTVSRFLENRRIIGTIARHGHPWVGLVRRRPDVHLVELDASNRDAIVPQFIQRFQHDLEIPIGS